MGHLGCECRLEEEGGSAFFKFGKETEDLCSMSAPGIGPARFDDMLLLPSTWAHEKGLSTKAGIPELWDSAVPVISGTGATQFVPSHLVPTRGTGINLRVLHKRLRLHR